MKISGTMDAHSKGMLTSSENSGTTKNFFFPSAYNVSLVMFLYLEDFEAFF